MTPEETIEIFKNSGYSTYRSKLTKLSKNEREKLAVELLSLSKEKFQKNQVKEGLHYLRLANLAALKAPQFLNEKVNCLKKTAASVKEGLDEIWYECGKAQMILASLSGEPSEHLFALKCFENASLAGMKRATFFQEYGTLLYTSGMLLGRADLFLTACEFLTRACEMRPSLFKAWRDLAFASFAVIEIKGDVSYLSLCNDSFNQALSLKPREFSLWREWGRLDMWLAMREKNMKVLHSSVKKLKRAFQLSQDDPENLYELGLALYCLGEVQEDIDTLKRARGALFAAACLSPNIEKYQLGSAAVLFAIARYFDSETHYQESLEAYQKLIYNYPKNPTVYVFAVRSCLELYGVTGDVEYIDQALMFCEETKAMNPYLRLYYGKALYELAYLTGNKAPAKKGLQELEKAIGSHDVDPESLDEIRFTYGKTLVLLGEMGGEPYFFEQAITIFQKLVDKDPRDFNSLYQLALSLSYYGEMMRDFAIMQGALHAYEDAIQLNPEDDRVWHDMGVSLIQLGGFCEYNGLKTQAKGFYSQAEEKLKFAATLGNPLSHYALAHLNALKGDFELSIKFLETSHKYGCLPPMEELLSEESLLPLHNEPKFQELIFSVEDE